jgi:hypothetical protein
MAVLLMACLAGCYSPDLLLKGQSRPTNSASAPTVSDLVDHMACELGKTYMANTIPKTNDGSKEAKDTIADLTSEHVARWKRLVDENFVVSVDLTLMVTRAEALNPSLSYIWPLTGAGNKISPLIYSGTGQTQATYNTTLAMGFQLNSTADRNVEQDFMIDMASLIRQYNFGVDGEISGPDVKKHLDADHPGDPSAGTRFPYCLPRDKVTRKSEISSSPLTGNMALFEMIDDGLAALDRSSVYNVYGTSGPTRLLDVGNARGGGHLSALSSMMGTGGGGTGATPSGQGGGVASAATGKTSFGSKVDFYIVWGINGGPTITTLDYKATAGSGGGGGGGAGGGAAAGAGGGGQLASYTRTTQDSLTATLGATCSMPESESIGITTISSPPPVAVMTHKALKEVKLDDDLQSLGWKPGTPLSGANVPPGTTIDSIVKSPIDHKTTLTISAYPTADGPDLWHVPATIITGQNIPVKATIHQGSDEMTVDTNVIDRGWWKGMPVSGAGLAALPPLSAILTKNSEEIELNDNPSSKGWAIGMPVTANDSSVVLPGTIIEKLAQKIQAGRTIFVVTLSEPVRRGGNANFIANPNSIESISADSHLVTLSQPAERDGHDVPVQVNIEYAFTVSAPHGLSRQSTRFDPEVFSTMGSPTYDTLTVTSSGKPMAVGSIQWAGYVLGTGDFSLRGMVNSGVTGQTIGQIWLSGNSAAYNGLSLIQQDLIVHFPHKLVSNLNDDFVTASYWDSVPACDVLTAAQRQNAVDAVGLQNQFQTFFRH